MQAEGEGEVPTGTLGKGSTRPCWSRERKSAMKQMLAVLIAWGTLLVGMGCGQGSSEAETKKAEQQMQQQMEQMSQELPAKID